MSFSEQFSTGYWFQEAYKSRTAYDENMEFINKKYPTLNRNKHTTVQDNNTIF